MMETVTFKLQGRVLKKVDTLLGPLHFNNRTEFIREAIREKLNLIETEKFMKKLAGYKGAAKKHLSDKEFETARRKAFKNLAEEYGVKLD